MHSNAGCIFLLLYVDDMIITGSDSTHIHNLKQFFHQHFQMKDLGHLQYIVGIEAAYSPEDQLDDTKTVSTPIKTNLKLRTTDGILFYPTCYRQAVSSLVYFITT